MQKVSLESSLSERHLRTVDEGNEVAEWLSTYMKTSCRLVRMADNFVRSVDQDYAQSDDLVGFADGYPFLLISTASLEDLNSRLDISAAHELFPNIVVSGCDAFAEDTWVTDAHRSLPIQCCESLRSLCCHCHRSRTGKRGPEPLRTLANQEQRKQGMFGQNFIPQDHRSD